MSTPEYDDRVDALRTLMTARGMSVRALARCAGVHASTVSRALGRRRTLTADLTAKLWRCLDAPVPAAQTGTSAETTVALCALCAAVGARVDIARIGEDLAKFEAYAATPEGERVIRTSFAEKVAATGGAGPMIRQLHEYYDAYCRLGGGEPQRAIMGSALLYFVQSVDAIPDYLFPVGYIDDAIALQLVNERLCALWTPSE
ncbi:MAG: DUF1232 domain-containing protein [Firmicutes bacterium]|nr:DUF1232 domain-containing protein [Bacillota bacterium]